MGKGYRASRCVFIKRGMRTYRAECLLVNYASEVCIACQALGGQWSLEVQPPAGSRGRAPGQGARGGSPRIFRDREGL